MEFNPRKLPQDAAAQLRRIPVEEMRPFVPLSSPVYVFLRQNQKFVSVKGPLDFFTPADLERFKASESFFLPPELKHVVTFEQAGRRLNYVLSFVPRASDSALSVELPPTPFELSDAVIRIIGPLWGSGRFIEPFFPVILASALCGPLPSDSLLIARENDTDLCELGIMKAGMWVFLALHLGFCKLAYLTRMHGVVFKSVTQPHGHGNALRYEERQILKSVDTLIGGSALEPIKTQDLKRWVASGDPIAVRVQARLDRVEVELMSTPPESGTLHGEGGFLDVAG